MSTAEYSTELVALSDATPYLDAWDSLGANAAEPNPFQLPWFLIPDAIRAGDFEEVRLLLVHHRPEEGIPELVGLFPLVRKTRFGLLKMKALSLRVNSFTPLGTPLTHDRHGPKVLRKFLDWFSHESRSHFVELPQVAGDGAFHDSLSAALRRSGTAYTLESSVSRGLFRPDPSGMESYLAGAVPKSSHRQKLRARERNLAKKGKVEFSSLPSDGDLEVWVSEFLDLEKKGWKGREGTALACKRKDRDFFKQALRAAFARNELSFLSLRLDGRPIAMSVNFISRNGGFIFKIAYDEDFSEFAPGIQLNLENMRRMHESRSPEWVDSCADPSARFYNDVWSGRREIRFWLISKRRFPQELILHLLSGVRYLRSKMKTRGPQSG